MPDNGNRKRLESAENRAARQPVPEYPLAHLDSKSVSELHPSARDLLEAIRAYTGKPHTEATEGECQAAFRAYPAALRAYLDHLLDVEAAEQSTEPGTTRVENNVYTRTEES